MGILTPALNLTKSIVRQFLQDRGVRELVTYRKWTSQQFDEAQKFNVDTFTETANVKTIRLQSIDKAAATQMGLSLEAGQVLFMIDSADVPAGASMKDQIADGNGVTFKIAEIRPVFGIVHAFVCEGAT